MNESNSFTQENLKDSLNNEKQSYIDKNTKRDKKKLAVVAFFILLILGASWFFFLRESGVLAQFELEAVDIDVVGIKNDTSFILKSSENISVLTIKKYLKFEPEVEFDISKKSGLFGFNLINKVFAEDGESTDTIYEIKPKESLDENKIYKVIISESAIAERDYSWAFQVKADFQVVSTHPRKESSGVPINSGIEVNFNRENLINPEKYFSIEPHIEGDLEIKDNKLVFLPKEALEPISIYTATIKEGLKVKGSDDKLKNDFVFKFETGQKNYATSKPYLYVSNDFVEFIPNREPVIQVYPYNLSVNDLEFGLYKFSSPEEFINSYQESRSWDLGWTYYYKRYFNSSYDTSEIEKVLSFKPKLVEVGYNKYIEIPQALESGYYILETEIDGKKRQIWLQINPLAHYFSLTNENSLIWINNFESKEKVKDVEVSYLEDNNTLSLGRTDSQGLVQFEAPENVKQSNDKVLKPYFFSLKHNQYPTKYVKIIDGWGWWYGNRNGDAYWDHLSTDRYAYQMSDTVHYWGVVKGRNQDLRNKKVTVGLMGGSYGWGYDYYTKSDEYLLKQEVVVSSFDTIQGQFNFNGLTPGYYSLVVLFGDQIISRSSVRVLSYAKPTYQIKITPSKEVAYAGENIDFKIEASFFDGTPVQNLKIKYNFYWLSSVQGNTVLDSNGQAVISYTPEYLDSERVYYPRSLSLTAYPELSEEGEIRGTIRTLIFGPSLYMQTYQEKFDNGSHELRVKVNNIDISQVNSPNGYYQAQYIGNPAQGQLVIADVYKVVYNKTEIGQYYDYINRVTRKTYNYTKQESKIETLRGTTNKEGEWIFARNFPKEDLTRYYIKFHVLDNKGRIARSTQYIWNSVQNYTKAHQEFIIDLQLSNLTHPDEQFSYGDKVNLELDIIEGNLPDNYSVLFYQYQNNIRDAKIVNSLVYQDIFEKEDAPSMTYQAVVLGPYGLKEANSVTASYNEENSRLEINVSPDKEKYRPGEEVKLDFEVKDQRDKGTKSEVNVSVVDEALFHVLPYEYYSKDLLTDLYKNIWVRPLTQASEYALLKDAGAEAGGCFVGDTKILTINSGLKDIKDVKIGDQIITLDLDSNKQVSAVVQGVSKHLVNSYLIINNTLKVTPEHRLYINDSWQYAGLVKIGDYSLNSQGQKIKIESINMISDSTMVYNIVVNKHHTYLVDNFYVHNGEKGGEARSEFVDVAYYGSQKTDNNGKFSINFVSPDNITAWRITTKAFAPDDLKAGQSVDLIKTSLPFFTDVVAADTYLTGDKPQIRTRVFGEDYQIDGETAFNLSCEALNYNQQLISKNNQSYFSLSNLPSGDYEFLVSAKQGNKEDALYSKIKVVDSYFKISESSIYQLSDNIKQIESNQNGFTKLKFVDMAKGRLYRSLLSSSYQGGIRSDQLATKFYAKEFLKEHFEEDRVNDNLNLGQYQSQDGGVTLFPYSDNDLALTSLMADLASDYLCTDKTKSYLYNSLSDELADVHRISQSLYGLASLNELVLPKIYSIQESTSLEFKDNVYLALALAKIGDKERAIELYNGRIKDHIRIEGGEAWLDKISDQTNRVKTTALVAILASYLDQDESFALGQYILTHNPINELDKIEEMLYVRSELAKSYDGEVGFKYRTKDRSESVTLEKGKSYTLNLSQSELDSIEFNSIKGTIALISYYERAKDTSELTKNTELSLSRVYFVDNQQTNEFKEGDTVLVRLDPNIAQSAIDGQYQVIDYLPSGLKPITRYYEKGLSTGSHCDSTWYPSIIEDNKIYFNIWKGFNGDCSNRTINYYARVISKGEFKANPAMIQSLKNLDSLNISTEQRVIID